MEVGSRRILHCNATEHPAAEWTTQQFREFLAFDHPYRYIIHDRDAIFSSDLDTALKGFGVRGPKTPVRASKGNAFCERLIGSIRRECLDILIPLGERHIKRILREVCRSRPVGVKQRHGRFRKFPFRPGQRDLVKGTGKMINAS
jgi:putative transposase